MIVTARVRLLGAFRLLTAAWLTSRPALLVVTRAVTCNVLLLPIASLEIVVQIERPERLKPGAETTVNPDGGVSQTRTFIASASPMFDTRSA